MGLQELSRIPAERQLQRHVLLLVGWVIVSVVAMFVAQLPSLLDEPGGEPEARAVGLEPVRLVLGAVAVLLAARLVLLVRRHLEAIATVAGLKRQYVTAAVVTAVVGVPGFLFWWWLGPVGSVLGVLALVLALRVRTVPAAEMTERIQYDDPAAWQGDASAGVRRPWLVLVLACVGGLVLAAVIVAVVLVAAA